MAKKCLWYKCEPIELKNAPNEPIIKITNIENVLYCLTVNYQLYHGIYDSNLKILDLKLDATICARDIAIWKNAIYHIDLDGRVWCAPAGSLGESREMGFGEDTLCPRGHCTGKETVQIAWMVVSDYGQLFVTDQGALWACGRMPPVGIDGDQPKRVQFFRGRRVRDAAIGTDFAIVVVDKKNDYDEEEMVFNAGCPRCVSSQLTSPSSLTSISDLYAKSYEAESGSTASSAPTGSPEGAKNIIFINTEAAKEFLTRQISRMSSAGEDYLEPTRILKENMTNVATLVYEGVRTVGDKVATLSRHVSGSSDCNASIKMDEQRPSSTGAKDLEWSMSQCTSDREASEREIGEKVEKIVGRGTDLIGCEVWTWGNIVHGQLGIGDKIKRERPTIITKLSNMGVRKCTVQSYHTAVLTLDGRAYLWGRNDHNQVTNETKIDQSSPKLYNGEQRIKDVACGDYHTLILTNQNCLKYFGKSSEKTMILNDTQSITKEKILISQDFLLMNVSDVLIDNFLLEHLSVVQKLLEEMLNVHNHLIKQLTKKNVEKSFEDLAKSYTDLMHVIAVEVDGLIGMTDCLKSTDEAPSAKNSEEFVAIFTDYSRRLCDAVSVDGMREMAKVLDVPNCLKPTNDMEKSDVIGALLQSPLDFLTRMLEFARRTTNGDNARRWAELYDETMECGREALRTRDFWREQTKTLETLKQPMRRLVRDARNHPLHLENASRFTSHSFILFTDCFVHVVGSTPMRHDLRTIWLEALPNAQIRLRTPEETLILYTDDAETKNEWYHLLQNAIAKALHKNDTQAPNVRNATYTFTQKNARFKDATYRGRWSSAKMHGNGRLEWDDGRYYHGQFMNGAMHGWGVMATPTIGTYEGNWRDNKENGRGVMTYCNTDIYKGGFKDGLPHGHGFLRKGQFGSHAASFYIGDWSMGMKSGYGVMDDVANGEKYIGNWQDDKRHGIGVIITSDGIYYEGNFYQDCLTVGTMVLDDGTRYDGEFRGTGLLNGKGILRLPSGHVVEGTFTGTWNDGLKINTGILTKNIENVTQESEFTIPVQQKWKALFDQCYQLLGINNTINTDTKKIWQNIAAYLSNASEIKRKQKNLLQNSLDNLDIIPAYERIKLDLISLNEYRQYLNKAFESTYHPLGSLLTDLVEAYTTTYGGHAHPLLLPHAIAELHYVIRRLHELIVILFPTLPPYGRDLYMDESDETINHRSLLYPMLLPRVHHPLFTLFCLKNELNEKLYKKTLKKWNKQTDRALMVFLSVDQKFHDLDQSCDGTAKDCILLDAIDTLQQLKSTFSPNEKLFVIRQTVEKVTPIVQKLLGDKFIWSMDDLFPMFLYVVVRARIPDLGSELDFMENFMDSSWESGELGIMYTTLKACYQQILQEKSV